MKTVALPAIVALKTALNADQIAIGLPLTPLDRVRIISSSEWEDFTLEYAHSLKSSYHSVERHAGSGDLGCDIVARIDASPNGPWDNYQCKHYKDALSPSMIWAELAKFCYYTFIGEYVVARKYYFVAPCGVGPSLSSLLKLPEKLRTDLFKHWDSHCRKAITSKEEIILSDTLRAHIESIDFSIFSALSPLKMIEQHSSTPWHAARFGGGLRSRMPAPEPPEIPGLHEATYVRALLDVYEEKLGISLASIDNLKDIDLAKHLQRARCEFYSAESLREFSRDSVPAGTFEKLLDEVYSGVIDVIEWTHPNSMERVLACVKQAKALALASNALVSRVSTTDKGGMCHQLSNEKRVIWRK